MSYQPYFRYTEIFKDDSVCRAWSTGNGIFTDSMPECLGDEPCFMADKDRRNAFLSVTIRSPQLSLVLIEKCGIQNPLQLDLRTLLKYYETFNGVFDMTLDDKEIAQERGITELRLLVHDFLCDAAIFEGYDLEALMSTSLLSQKHWQDMQHCTVEWDLDTLDSAFNSDIKQGQKPLRSLPARHALPDHIQQQIRNAIEAGDSDTVVNTLQQNEGLIQIATWKRAQDLGRSDVAQIILDQGVTMNIKEIYSAANNRLTVDQLKNLQFCIGFNSHGYCETPLQAAIWSGHYETIQYICEKGAEVNTNNQFLTPLKYAARGGHLAVVQYLCERGAEVNTNNEFYTPLQRAAQGGRLAVVQYLCQKSIWENEISAKIGILAAIFSASFSRHKDTVECLQDSALQIGAIEGLIRPGNAEKVREFLDVTPDFTGTPSYPDLWGGQYIECDELAVAALVGDLAIVRLLMEHGFQVQKQGYESLALYCACYQGHTSIAIHLASNGASLGATAKEFLRQRWNSMVPWISMQRDFPDPDDEGQPRFQSRDRSIVNFVANQEPEGALEGRHFGLRKSLAQIHKRFLNEGQTPVATEAFAQFSQENVKFLTVWKQGMSTIRSIMRNKPPDDLSQVVNCLFVADAMRSCRSHRESGLETSVIWDAKEFSEDLVRWRALVPDKDKSLFDEIAVAMWGAQTSPGTPSHRECVEQNLCHLQKLLSHLISDTSSTYEIWAERTSEYNGGYRLHTIQSRYTYTTKDDQRRQESPTLLPAVDPTDIEQEREPPDKTSLSDELAWESLGKHIDINDKIVMVAAGVVFGVILAFLLYMRLVDGFAKSRHIFSSRGIATCCKTLAINTELLKAYMQLPTRGFESCCRGEVGSTTPHSQSTNSTPLAGVNSSSRSIASETSSGSGTPGSHGPTGFIYSPQEENTGEIVCSPNHNSRENHTCVDCGKSFSKKFNLNKHRKSDCMVRRENGTTKKFYCDRCSKGFTRNAYRLDHQNRRKCKRRLNARNSSTIVCMPCPPAEQIRDPTGIELMTEFDTGMMDISNDLNYDMLESLIRQGTW